MKRERVVHQRVRAAFQEAVRRDDDAADAVVLDEEAYHVVHIWPERRLAAREPEVCDGGHRPRDALDLLEGQVARAVQFLVVEAGLALRVAARRDEEDDRAEPSLTARGAEELDELCDLVRHPAR